MSQDETLVAHTTNTAINPANGAPFDATDPANLPRSSADASVHTLNLNASVGGDLARNLTVTGRLRYYRYNDQTDPIAFEHGYTRFDAVWEEIPRITVAYDWSKRDLGFSSPELASRW
jgi:hypothetical protein